MISNDPADEIAGMIDLLASEYGWTRETIMELPIDQTPQLVHAILVRKGVRVFRKSYEVDSSLPTLSERMRAILDTGAIEE